MVPTCEVFHVHGQPPPDVVECMSQSEPFKGMSMPYSIDALWNSLHVCILHDETTCDADLVASISSVPNCRSGRQEWLFKGPNVCLVTLALL